MINIDKDYLITVDLKNTKVKSDKTIFFYNTDLNICNIFIKLICTDEDKTIPDDLIVEFAVLKPETDEFKPLDATLISKEDLLYQVDLTTDYFDIVGKYSCEIRVSGTIENESKCFTSEEFDYVVKPNITAKLDKKIKNDKNLPVLEKLIKDVKEVTDGINKNEIQMKRDENLVGDNKTVVGAINQLREDVNSGIGGGTVDLTNYQKKNDEFLNTDEKTITGGINEVNNKIKKVQESQIELDKDDVSFNGIDDISHDELNTTNKTIIGAINEVNTQYKDIANKLKLVAGDNNTIKLMFGDKELSSITINGGTIEKPVYGNIIFDKNFVKIGENGTGKIGIKLDKKPTQTQTISISEDSDILSVDKTSLTFTSNNYDTYQYITITVGNIDTSETVNIKFINSDELLTESNASIYVVADGDEYNVDTTFPTGAYTVTSADFTDNTVNGDYVILGAYSGTKSNIIVPATMEVDGATKKVMLKSATFSTNTTIQYIQIDSATVINMHGTINQIATSSLNSAFAKCTSLIGFKYDCNRVDNISNTWSGCSKLKFVVGLDNYVKCSDMSQAFMNCSELEYIQDLSKLTLCTNLTQTFNGCTKLKKIYGLPSGATNMNMALYKCAVLENIVIPKNVTDLFYCFSGNTSLKKIEILSEGVTRADQMLQNCGTVSVYMVKDSTTYTTISKIYSSSANVTLAYIGADSIPVISTWGDSTTSRGTDGLAWPSRLQNEITTHNVKNMAISGEFTTSTSCRQGGNQAHVKTAFTIPATCTEVEVELESKDKQTFSNGPVLSTGCNYNPVTISNIEGSISCKNNKYYFTRYKEGNEVQVNANTEVISKTSEARKNDDIMIIYLGTNSGWNDTPAELLAQVQSMVNYYQGTKYIIATGATGYRLRTESTRAITTQVETLFSTTFGEHYFNLRQYLIDNSLTENSLTATDVDNSRIALGQVPASILMGASDLNAGKAGGDGVDDTHYNTYGLESVKNAFKSKLISLGYITIN